MALGKGRKNCSTSMCSSSTESKIKTVTFALNAPNANRVMLAGTFNNWHGEKTLLRKGKTGWETTMLLKPGKYEYKFVVDGKWINDPINRWSISNSYGTQNSVIEVKG